MLWLLPVCSSRAQTAPSANDTSASGDNAPGTEAGPAPRTKKNKPAAAGNDALAKTAQDGPIDIAASGETTYNSTEAGRIATATSNVNIQTNDASIFSDYAEYNLDTHEALLIGNVRIYRADNTIVAERAVYNLNTKAIRAVDFTGSRTPYSFAGESVFSPGAGLQYNLRHSDFTTDDSSKPDFKLRSRRVRIYPDNRIIYIGSTLVIGTTPVFYFPYFFQSLDQQSGYTLSPGYTSEYGAYLLAGITFPVTDHLTGLLRLDYRTERGAGGGLSFEYKPNRRPKKPPTANQDLTPYESDDDPSQAVVITGPPATASPNNQTNLGGAINQESTDDGVATGRTVGTAATGDALSRQIHSHETAQLVTYFTEDNKSDLNRTSLDRLPISSDRYRISLKDTSFFFNDDFFVKADIDKISDRYLLQDFYQGEFTRNPNPDNVVSAVFYQPHFVTTLLARAQLNNFFDATERLPELSIDIPRVPLWNTGINYTGQTSTGYIRRTFDDSTPLPDYNAFRIDSFHQLSYPKTLFGWLSVVPRLGVRGTYYSHSAPDDDGAYNLQLAADGTADRLLLGLNPNLSTLASQQNLAALRSSIAAFAEKGDIFRPVVNAGLELSFKLSRIYDGAQDRAIGLDKMQHVIQPYVNFSEVEDFGIGSRELLQFDRRVPTTQLRPLDFPEFTPIDSIDESTVVRMGVRNRLQTKRDSLTVNWLEMDTFFQANINNSEQGDPNETSRFSNVFNQLTLRPVPWVNLTIDSQLPLLNPHTGFTEVDTALNFLPTSNVELTISHRYLNDNPFFLNSSLLGFTAFVRLNDNWAVSAAERYEFADSTLEAQSYTIYRDLTSFVASFALTVQSNNSNTTNKTVNSVGVLLNFTLKGIPKVSLPVGFDVNALGNQTSQ